MHTLPADWFITSSSRTLEAKDVRKELGQGKRPFLCPLASVGERKGLLVCCDLILHYPIVLHVAMPASLY